MNTHLSNPINQKITNIHWNARASSRTSIFKCMETQKKYTYWLKAIEGSDEVQARRYAAAMALEIGWGGVSNVQKLTGMSHSTIEMGISELRSVKKLEVPDRLRKKGGGRKKVEIKDVT